MKTFLQPDRLKSPPKGVSVYARNNLWGVRVYTLLIWDEKLTGDGPGGTADCAARVKKLGGPDSDYQPHTTVGCHRACR